VTRAGNAVHLEVNGQIGAIGSYFASTPRRTFGLPRYLITPISIINDLGVLRSVGFADRNHLKLQDDQVTSLCSYQASIRA
jgi:hypothetical protein